MSLEAIFFDVNPSLKQLTENAQRSSEQLMRTQQKEMKKLRASKSVPVDSTDLSTEAELMGGDLMGSMDPDQFRGRRRGSSFQEEKEKRHNEDNRKKEKKKDAQEGIKSLLCALTENNYGDIQDENIENAKAGEAESASFNNEFNAEISNEENVGQQWQDQQKKEMPKRSGIENSQSVNKDLSLPEKERFKGKEELEIKENADKKAEKLHLGREKINISSREVLREKSVRDTGSQKQSNSEGIEPQSTSLLSWDEGFIIADPRNKSVVRDDADETHYEYEQISLPDDEDGEDSVSTVLIEDMLLENESLENINLLKKALNPFGNKILKICKSFGIRICILESSEDISSVLPPELYGRNYGGIEACFVPEEKLCIVQEKYLRQNSEIFNVVRLYFAHSFDNALGKDEFASLKSAAVMSNFNACRNMEKGHQFIDLFSSLSPVHYFAQSVESYLSDDDNGKCLCSRNEFYDLDRSMYLYVEYLFRVINKEPPKNLINLEEIG